MKHVANTSAMAAIRSQAPERSAFFHLRLADAMTSSHFEEISATDTEERTQEFRLALQDPDRLAGLSLQPSVASRNSSVNPSKATTPMLCSFGASPTRNGSSCEGSILVSVCPPCMRSGTKKKG